MSATALKIRIFDDPAIRRKAKPVKAVTKHHRDILSEMARLMYETKGIGLAANQAGIDESMAVVDIGTGLYKLINPKIVKKEGSQSMEEGCLSVPGVSVKVKRAERVVLKALDEEGRPITAEARGLLACVFQHEIDHLNARLIIDHASLFEKLKIKRRLSELKRRAKFEELSEPKTKPYKL